MATVILDFETSGLNAYHADIIEIGAKILGSEQSFQCLVKPESGKEIEEKITKITGITNRELRANGINYLQSYSNFHNWLVDNITEGEQVAIVSHNGDSFDFIFFRRLMNKLFEENLVKERFESKYEIVYLDTLHLVRRLYPQMYSFKQETLCKYFGIKIDGAHRAFNDVLCLEQLYQRVLKDLTKKYQTINIGMVKDYILLRI